MVLEEPPAEAEEDLTHFDTVQGGETAPEPRREIPAVPPAESAPPASPPAAGGDATGKFFVQVGALRDRQAAAELVRALEARGYGVRLFSEREGTGTLYKVRVGGYASEPDARAAASALKAAGYPGAFVRPAD
jgi:cell division septation protein DedD